MPHTSQCKSLLPVYVCMLFPSHRLNPWSHSGSHTTPIVQCWGPAWPSKDSSTLTPFVLEPVICVLPHPPWCPERTGNRATPTERTSLPVLPAILAPNNQCPCPRGCGCYGWEPGEGRSYAFSLLFSSQSFQFHHLHKLVSIRGLVDSKPGHYPESVHRVRRTAGVSWLRMPRQCFPSFGSSVDSHCFLWWLVGFWGFFFQVSLI